MKKGSEMSFKMVFTLIIILIVAVVVILFILPNIESGKANIGNVTQGSENLLGNASEGLTQIKVS